MAKMNFTSVALGVRDRAHTVTLIVVSSAILSWVALFNGSPLVFPDTVSYATAAYLHEVPGMFSAYYSIFILPLHQGVTLWPVVLVQAGLLSHLLYLVARCVSGGKIEKSEILLIVAALSVFSSMPWFTGQIMPDVFSPVILLGIFLLAFCPDRLGRGELLYVGALTAAGITTHLSHVPIALGLILLCGALRPIFAPAQIRIRRWAALLLVPFVLAVCSMLAVNWINSRQIVFARNSNVFLLAKWIEEGPALAHLEEACPVVRYSLCPYVEEMRGQSQGDLKWVGASPFYKVGGFDDLEPEARRIVWGTLRAYPAQILERAITNTRDQLLHFEIGDGLTPESINLVALQVGEFLDPGIAQSLRSSKQAEGRLPIAEFRELHRLGLLFCLGLALWSLIAGR